VRCVRLVSRRGPRLTSLYYWLDETAHVVFSQLSPFARLSSGRVNEVGRRVITEQKFAVNRVVYV